MTILEIASISLTFFGGTFVWRFIGFGRMGPIFVPKYFRSQSNADLSDNIPFFIGLEYVLFLDRFF